MALTGTNKKGRINVRVVGTCMDRAEAGCAREESNYECNAGEQWFEKAGATTLTGAGRKEGALQWQQSVKIKTQSQGNCKRRY